MLVGYARVSTARQAVDRQLDALREAGVSNHCLYVETATGGMRSRTELDRMLSNLAEGDVVVVEEASRISRSTRDLLSIIDQIHGRGASIRSLSDSWLDTSRDDPVSKFVRTVMAGLVELERDQMRERTLEGLEAARARGRVGGRPQVRADHEQAVSAMRAQGRTVAEIVAAEGISRSTVYRIIRDLEDGDA